MQDETYVLGYFYVPLIVGWMAYKQWLSLFPTDTCKNNSMRGTEDIGV